MANSISSRKRVRQNEKRRARNRWRLRAMRDSMKEFLDKIAHGSKEEAQTAYSKCVSVIDKTAQRGVIHKNQAARRKSRLNARLKAKATA
jgi:small subunit ribosomal protein S20